MPKISGYDKTFKVKDEIKDKNNKLMSFRIDDEKLLKKYKAIWTNSKILMWASNLMLNNIIRSKYIFIFFPQKCTCF